MELSGQAAVVTGGASGIGKAIALRLAAEGARVFIGDLDAEGGNATVTAGRDAGLEIEFHHFDLTDSSSIVRFAGLVQERAGGRVDALVNAAGFEIVQPFLENPPGFLEKIMKVNLLGPIELTRALVTEMTVARKGGVVNIASDAARVGSRGEVVYSAAKGGLIAFTKSLAREMAMYGVRVNCICPGPTDTPMFHLQSEKTKESLARAIPLRRIGQPGDIADAVQFFLSAQSRFITGQVLSVSGGLTMAD